MAKLGKGATGGQAMAAPDPMAALMAGNAMQRPAQSPQSQRLMAGMRPGMTAQSAFGSGNELLAMLIGSLKGGMR